MSGLANGPVTLPNPERGRRRGFNGEFSCKQQATALAHLRTYERAKACDEVPDPKRCLGGDSMLALWRRKRHHVCHVDWSPELCAITSWREREAIQVVLCAQLCSQQQALMAPFETLAERLGCHYDTVSKTMRRLVEIGLLAWMPYHVTDGRNHERRANQYWVSERAMAELGVRARPRVAPPPAPGVPGRVTRARVDDPPMGSSVVRSEFPDPSEIPDLSADPILPGDPVREAPHAGAVIDVVPDAAAVHGSNASVPTQPDSVFGGSGTRRVNAPPTTSSVLRRLQHAEELELFRQRETARLTAQFRRRLAEELSWIRRREAERDREAQHDRDAAKQVIARLAAETPTKANELQHGLVLRNDAWISVDDADAESRLARRHRDLVLTLFEDENASRIEPYRAGSAPIRNVEPVDDREVLDVIRDLMRAHPDRFEGGGDS